MCYGYSPFFEVGFTKDAPKGIGRSRGSFSSAASPLVTQGALRFSLQANRMTYAANSSSSAFASFRSSVSSPSVNQP